MFCFTAPILTVTAARFFEHSDLVVEPVLVALRSGSSTYPATEPKPAATPGPIDPTSLALGLSLAQSAALLFSTFPFLKSPGTLTPNKNAISITFTLEYHL